MVLYPRKGCLLADSCRGPIVFTYVLFWVSKTLEAFQFRGGFLPKKIFRKFLETSVIKSPGEALSTFTRASRGPKGEQEVWVAKRLSYCPKILQNRKMPEKWVFEPDMVKNDPSNQPKWPKFWPIILTIGVIYRPLELKIHTKVGLLRSKIMPKQLLNNFEKVQKTTFLTTKMIKNYLSKPPKWSKFFAESFYFHDHLSTLRS